MRKGRGVLLERESELARLRAWLADAATGQGRAALVVGSAGMGKTTLLDAAADLACDFGLLVLAARGRELERELPFGVARQLFERPVARMNEAARTDVAAGPAALALAVLAADAGVEDPRRVIHGLYWLLTNLSERGPLLVVVDDAHWADVESLRWLLYVASRVWELPVFMLSAARPDEPGAERPLIDVMATDEEVAMIRLPPLSKRAVAEVIQTALGTAADAEFVYACARATGGNPFFVREFLRVVERENLAPVAANAARADELVTDDAARSVERRLNYAGDRHRLVAEAVAVLGTDAEPRHVAVLADLRLEAVLDLAAELARADILRDARPLEFIHPLARAAVYRRLSPGARSRLHRRAADLLVADGAPPERVATQVLAVEPAGDPVIVEWLREAARLASASAAPESAASYLQRALDEPPAPANRAAVWLERGRALTGLDLHASADCFARAAENENPAVRLLAHRWRAQSLGLNGRPGEAVAAAEEAARLASDPEERLLLEATRDFFAIGWLGDPDWKPRWREAIARAGPLRGTTPGERRLLGVAAFAIARTGEDSASVVIELTNRVRAARGDWFEQDGGVETSGALGMSSMLAEDPESLPRHEKGHSATRHGMVVFEGSLYSQLAELRLRRGDLLGAESDARTSWRMLAEERASAGSFYWWSMAGLVAVLIARGALEEAAALADWSAPIEETCTLAIAPLLPVVLGELDVARGRIDAGIERLLRDGAQLEQCGWGNPSLNPWRARVAAGLAAAGRLEEAREIIGPAIERARRFGAPWALGMALRAGGVVEPGERGLELLREAIEVLEAGGNRVEQAHAELEFGAALRRANRRVDGREHLRVALDLAYRCGATRLAERAREELAATGARPRRVVLSGVDALTASELRVARLAAAGHSNPEIAQVLFVTRKTVETHLGRVFSKLDIRTRAELADALDPAAVIG